MFSLFQMKMGGRIWGKIGYYHRSHDQLIFLLLFLFLSIVPLPLHHSVHHHYQLRLKWIFLMRQQKQHHPKDIRHYKHQLKAVPVWKGARLFLVYVAWLRYTKILMSLTPFWDRINNWLVRWLYYHFYRTNCLSPSTPLSFILDIINYFFRHSII